VTVTRTWFGVVVLILAYFAVGTALGSVHAVGSLGMPAQAGLLWLICASMASWVVRRGFWVPAAAVWLATWVLVIALLYFIAAPTGQASVVGILQFNALTLTCSAVTAMLGASVGSWRARAAGRREQAT
jgi:hypothetical protein